jgi:hypothetical protein
MVQQAPNNRITNRRTSGAINAEWGAISAQYYTPVEFGVYCTKMADFAPLFAAYCARYSAFVVPNPTYTDVYCTKPNF